MYTHIKSSLYITRYALFYRWRNNCRSCSWSSAIHMMRQLNTFLRGDLNEFMELFLVTTSVDMSITPLQPYSIYICAFPYTCKSI